jgi:hypothetical protein
MALPTATRRAEAMQLARLLPERFAKSAPAALLVAVVAFLPFARGFGNGGALYFRDLSRHFFPLRLFALDGLRLGELRYWNPLNHEGIPLPFPPIGYPLDLLQLLWADERGLSFLLALHLPLAAVAFFALARGLEASRTGACAGALIYSLGGFALSTLNLYVYVEALAWAPLAILALRRVHAGGKAVAQAALLVGLLLSTAGIELCLQALMAALLLAPWERGRSLAWGAFAALVLGAALAAPVLLPMSAITSGTERALGFSADVVLNQSVHPFTLLQTVVGNLYGDLGNLANRWWGSNFFENGFPYILSLYLGAPALVLAAFGVPQRPLGRRLVLAVLIALVVCLGRFFVLAHLVEALPQALRAFRFPTKAFYAVHLAVALLAAFGLDRLVAAAPRVWRHATCAWALSGLLLAAAPLLPRLAPAGTQWFLAHFFPPGIPAPLRPPLLSEMLGDAAVAGLLCLACAALAALVALRRLAAFPAGVLLAAIVGGDLLRTGAGLNPMVRPDVLRVSPEVVSLLGRLEARQRLHSCDPKTSAAYWKGRFARQQDHEVFTFATWMETLAPNYNMPPGVATALSEDLTSLVPVRATPRPGEHCRNLPALLPRLREGAVTHVLSLDPLEHPDLGHLEALPLRRVPPLSLHVYALRDPLPFASLAEGRLRSFAMGPGAITVTSESALATRLLVRSGFSPGWRARVNGTRTDVSASAHGHLQLLLPPGRSNVELRYHPPGLVPGAAAAALALAIVIVLLLRRPRDFQASIRREEGL